MNTIGIDAPMLAAGLVTWLIILSGLLYLLHKRVNDLEQKKR